MLVDPGQTLFGPAIEKIGLALIETVNGSPTPVHVMLEFRSSKVPLYVPDGALTGTIRLIAAAGRVVNGLTLTNPALNAALS